MRILIDHGQYDHLNTGDTAMLQSCIARLQEQWPGAEIMVLTNAPGLLLTFCPGVKPIRLAYADNPMLRVLPYPVRTRLERLSHLSAKMVRPASIVRSQSTSSPRTVLQGIRRADLVVASGGGYVTDVFAANAVRVLLVLQVAQALRKKTAMFGQGLGPISRPVLRKRSKAVFPVLTALGLREGITGPELAISLGTDSKVIDVTGDDALEKVATREVATGSSIGVNIRVADYAGVDPANAQAVSDILLQAVVRHECSVVGLPVSRQSADSDLNAIQKLAERMPENVEFILIDLDSPDSLADYTSRCRIVITGSYHAAVFALAQGIPAICLTKSAYYDGKFKGLNGLFPDACFVVSLADDDFASRLSSAIEDAWELPDQVRRAARELALAQREVGRKAYKQFRERVESNPIGPQGSLLVS